MAAVNRKSRSVVVEARKPVVCQFWDEHEYEPGWGASVRHDFYTLHLTAADRDLYVKDYLDSHAKDGSEKPSKDGYNLFFRPAGDQIIDVSEAVYDLLVKAKTGKVKLYDSYKAAKFEYGFSGPGKYPPKDDKGRYFVATLDEPTE